MLARALEALCRDVLEKPEKSEATTTGDKASAKPTKRLMLWNGIQELRERKIIDDRLYDWSVSLHAMRNLAAHPEDITVSREDAEDLQVFVNAITEYVYDLTDRYDEFKEREAEKKRPQRSISEMFGGVAERFGGVLPGPPKV
jgi:predicted alpha/beta superfamily hydrolase